ncbi:protein MIZU-KUSSEI 1-like [Curcuma longa]|uniref:protein MIZU-KUSSEI 1-like n=1 Tax=Curcuma longa TaxID=136217 RepID=UPI003D9EE9B2
MAGPPPCPPSHPGKAAAAADPDAQEPSTVHHFPPILLQPSSQRRHNHSKSAKLLRSFRSAFRALPIIATPPGCHIPTAALSRASSSARRDGHGTRTTGTLFGHRKARITLAFQDNPRSVPLLLLQLAVPTARFMQDMGSSSLVRVALECEKKLDAGGKSCVLDEPLWAAYVNGRNVGYAARRDPTELDLGVMQLLHAVSMGAGVLPGDMTDPVDGELTYMRAYFDRVTGSKDSETFYMLNPDGNDGQELSIFFVRI